MKQFEKYFENLKSLIANNTPAIVVCGIKGLGKTNLIRSVCGSISDAVWIDYDFSLFKDAFKENFRYGLSRAAIHANIKIDSLDIKSSIEDEIFFIISCLTKDKKLILSFENIEDANVQDIVFIDRLIELNKSFYSACIIIEEDSDLDKKNNFSDLASKTIFTHIKIDRYSESDIMQYLCNCTNCSEISAYDIDLRHIFETAQGSLSVTNLILNDLLGKKYAEISDGILIIHELPKDYIINGVKEHVLNRFEKLNDEYKSLLAKTSCMGMTFDGNDAYNIFSIVRTYDILQTIQDASHLILRIEENEFKFESIEVHGFIHRNIGNYCNKSAVIKACAEYYADTLTEHLKKSDYKKYFRNLMLTKELFAALGDSLKLLACYRLLIGCKIDSGSFYEAIALCREYISICKDDNLNYISNLQLLYCFIETGKNSDAIMLADGLKSKSALFPANLEYYSAMAYYGISDGKTALKILLANIDCINKEEEALLYAQELRLISSIYDFYDDWENQLHYFNLAVKACMDFKLEREYYSLLRQSGMVYAPEIAFKHYEVCEKYFLSHNDIKELAKLRHNMATDSMYLCDFGQSHKRCLESIDNFKSIGCQGISNALNQKGILLCIEDKNYKDATVCFLDSAKLNDDKFMKCTAYINAATAYRRLGDFENYGTYLKMSKELNGNAMPVITVSEKICELLFAFQINDKKNCEALINDFSNIENYLENRHKYVLKMVAENFRLSVNYEFIKKENIVTNYINSLCGDYINKCMEEKCFWATTRFWEN